MASAFVWRDGDPVLLDEEHGHRLALGVRGGTPLIGVVGEDGHVRPLAEGSAGGSNTDDAGWRGPSGTSGNDSGARRRRA